MAKTSDSTKSERLRRSDPERDAPNRSGTEHIRRNARYGNGGDGPRTRISETLQTAISDMVQVSSHVIEDQIRAGQTAAERLRDGIAGSERLNADANVVIESLVKATKEVSATWLELLTIVLQSLGTKPHGPGSGPTPGKGGGQPHPRTRTKTGTSGGATTTSTITPADPTVDPMPVEIVVTGYGVKSVTLDLRPPTSRFMPVARQLQARDPKLILSTAQFTVSERQIVLSVAGPRDQPPGVYAGVVVDSNSNEAGGTVSVTIGG
jgi:hypothetical protein